KGLAFGGSPREKKGLSGDLDARRSLQVCIDNPSTKECHAVASLHTGRVRNMSNTQGVVIDVVSDTYDHTNITGLPPVECTPEEDKLREDLAQALADKCRPLWYAP